MMIIPECKTVGYASSMPCGRKVYFLSRYLIRETPNGYELIEVELEPGGMMREITSEKLLAGEDEICWHPEKVNIHNHALLFSLAIKTSKKCTIFSGYDEHITFVLDPDPSEFLTIHIYDSSPPFPHLSETLKKLEEAGLFGRLNLLFEHHILDIAEAKADVYPCRASGFDLTIDADVMHGGEIVAGCLTTRQIYTELWGENYTFVDICPLSHVQEEPFIARCCRQEREGVTTWNGKHGAIVHWGASPEKIAETVFLLAKEMRGNK